MTQTLTAVIPAAGCGARTGFSSNKILQPLAGHAVLWWTLRAFAGARPVLSEVGLSLDECVIAARIEEFAMIGEVMAAGELPFAVRLVEGGVNRQQSVQNAVTTTSADWVAVHDAARPLTSPALIAEVCQAALHHGAAIAAIPASDTVKCAGSGAPPVIKSTFERNHVWLAQTPQVFPQQLFLQALKSAQLDGFEGTDCASLMERIGQSVTLVRGESENFKITHAPDLEWAAYLLQKRNA